jgi:long-chain acyl-CoA synthetase
MARVLVRGDPPFDVLAQLLGVQPGDRIGIMLSGVALSRRLLPGAAGRRRRGADEPALKSREAEHYLGDSGSRLVFAWQACRPERV